jgi:hypothetical protein
LDAFKSLCEQYGESELFRRISRAKAFADVVDAFLQFSPGYRDDLIPYLNEAQVWEKEKLHQGKNARFWSPVFLDGLHSSDRKSRFDLIRQLLARLTKAERTPDVLTAAGIIFEKGLGVEIDARFAYQCYKQAGAHHKIAALEKSASPLIRGQLAEVNGQLAEVKGQLAVAKGQFQLAVEEYRKCGDLTGLAHLGDLLAASADPPTQKKGIQLLERASEHRSAFASFALGFRKGDKNLVREADRRGYADAGELLDANPSKSLVAILKEHTDEFW